MDAVLGLGPGPVTVLGHDEVQLVSESCRVSDERLEEGGGRVTLEARIRRGQDEDLHEVVRGASAQHVGHELLDALPFVHALLVL